MTAVTEADLWKLDSYSEKSKEDLSIQLELMIDEMFGVDNINSLIEHFAHIEGFMDGLMYARFITHFEHHDYLSPVIDAYHEALERLEDREAQT